LHPGLRRPNPIPNPNFNPCLALHKVDLQARPGAACPRGLRSGYAKAGMRAQSKAAGIMGLQGESFRLVWITDNDSANAMPQPPLASVSWDRMIRAVEKVRERLRRAAAALAEAGVPYAVADGNAVAAWVSRGDETAVRNTQDVDILLRRSDLDTATTALAKAGFVRRRVAGIEMFLDGPEAKDRDAVHIVLAGEKVRPEYVAPAPDVSESEQAEFFRLLTLEALVRMKLTSFRDKDRTHLRDLLEVGLLDASWLERLPAALRSRLQILIKNPEG